MEGTSQECMAPPCIQQLQSLFSVVRRLEAGTVRWHRPDNAVSVSSPL